MSNCENILKNLSILYAEDEDSIREMLKDVLKNDFKKFITAKDGVEALSKFKESKFDIVITDIEMPKMDGLALASEIKKISKNTPVILLTAYSEKERLFKAIDVGITKYLVKPFAPDKLIDIICEIAKKELELDKKLKLNENLYYDKIKKDVFTNDGKRVHLTKKELQFLELLIKNRNRVVTLEEIENIIWSDEAFSEAALRALVKRVRQKTSKELIKNFPGVGYRLEIKK
ncbi:response regulator transcription factor [Nitrosophilus kaiyonis]|uniref:response regulator transcription factor n=1 Tax=Nitrosophilus kaiyonis TaxID=2930200 RepID=UPI00249388DB|nr:response regulator transcription factor [Nitrosophilus kaiyonis]